MHSTHPRLVAGLAAALLLVTGYSATNSPTAAAVSTYGGWSIDGTVPPLDTEPVVSSFTDPSGTAELGPINSNTTKVNVINTAPLPMLGMTSVPAKTDFKEVWVGTNPVSGHLWFYFGWQRAAFTGSGYITIEFGKSAPPEACDYVNKTDSELIATCNPWANRAAGDFMLVWDQTGQSRVVTVRSYDGRVWGPAQNLATDSYAAEFSSDGYFGEAAVDLSANNLIDLNKCDNIGNVIPGTITGNSDNADYKDTVLEPIAAALNFSSCGSVTIRKATNPANYDANFTFTPSYTAVGTPAAPSAFVLNAKANPSWSASNVQLGAESTVAESSLPAGWNLQDITCVSTDGYQTPTKDLVTHKITFTLTTALNKLDCTFTNRATATLTISKVTKDDTGTFDFASVAGKIDLGSFSLTTTAIDTAVSKAFPNLSPGTYGVSESVPTGWGTVSATCSNGDKPGTITLNPGDNVTCTFTNQPLYGAIEITKLAKNAALGAGNHPLGGVTFTVTPGKTSATLTTPATDDTTGTVCVDGFRFGTYTVAEDAETAPGYGIEAPKSVTVGTASTCGSVPSSQQLTFVNTPLTDVTVSVAPQVTGATASKITCTASDGTTVLDPTPPDTSPTAFDDSSETVKDLTPGTYICTVVIDP